MLENSLIGLAVKLDSLWLKYCHKKLLSTALNDICTFKFILCCLWVLNFFVTLKKNGKIPNYHPWQL